jgi:hypothetical protein
VINAEKALGAKIEPPIAAPVAAGGVQLDLFF